MFENWMKQFKRKKEKGKNSRDPIIYQRWRRILFPGSFLVPELLDIPTTKIGTWS